MEAGIKLVFYTQASQQQNHHREGQLPTQVAPGSAGHGLHPWRGSCEAAGPTQGSGIGIAPHELHVSIHHLPHQLLQEGEKQMRAPAQGQMGSMSGMAQSTTSPPGPPQQNKERMGLGWALPTAALAQALVCQCTATVSAFFKARIHAEAPKMGFSVCPGHPIQMCPPSFPPPPAPRIAFRGHEHPAGTKHARKATHIKRDSRLPVQLLPGFGTVPLQKILWKRRKKCCKDCYLPHPDGLPIAPASL